jgi:uncharacterized RDD family membrane protein YckC
MDDGIRINTTQNVLINYQPAGVGDRILASLLDLLFVIAYIAVIAIIMSAIGHTFDGSDDEQMTAIVITTILTLPLMFYNLLMEQFFRRPNFGKKNNENKSVEVGWVAT